MQLTFQFVIVLKNMIAQTEDRAKKIQYYFNKNSMRSSFPSILLFGKILKDHVSLKKR